MFGSDRRSRPAFKRYLARGDPPPTLATVLIGVASASLLPHLIGSSIVRNATIRAAEAFRQGSC